MCSRNPVHQRSVSEMGWKGRAGCLLLAGGSPGVGWEAGSEIHTAGAWPGSRSRERSHCSSAGRPPSEELLDFMQLVSEWEIPVRSRAGPCLLFPAKAMTCIASLKWERISAVWLLPRTRVWCRRLVQPSEGCQEHPAGPT